VDRGARTANLRFAVAADDGLSMGGAWMSETEEDTDDGRSMQQSLVSHPASFSPILYRGGCKGRVGKNPKYQYVGVGSREGPKPTSESVLRVPNLDGDARRIHEDLSWFGQKKALRPTRWGEYCISLHLSACIGVTSCERGSRSQVSQRKSGSTKEIA
jgi:hypothetical protein